MKIKCASKIHIIFLLFFKNENCYDKNRFKEHARRMIMQLSKFTDYTFRVLIYMGMNPEKLYTVEQLADQLEVSEHHLKKVIYKLAKTEYVMSMKGRHGGIKLAVSPEEINLGEVLRLTEENLHIIQCIGTNSICSFVGENGCKLKGIIADSTNQFIKEFSKYTLQDLVTDQSE